MTPSLLLLLAACAGDESGPGGSSSGDDAPPWTGPSQAWGHAFVFGPPGGRIEGAEVGILELADRLTTTGEDGAWGFDDLQGGDEHSFVLTHPDHPVTQTATLRLDAAEVGQISFQVPTWTMYEMLSYGVGVEPDDETCQLATTVTRVGNSLYDTTAGTHGEPGATVTIDPPLAEEHGPVYFNLISADLIYPDPELEQTSDDGGVLYVNVPPGRYVLRADKPGTVFRDVVATCREGVLVNASPPWGLQAIEGGVGPRED